MTAPNKILYTAHVTTTGGRTGQSASDDGRLKVSLSTPKEMGGDGGSGTNPEQLFGAGYSACFLGALKAVARKAEVTLPEDTTVKAEIGFGPLDYGYAITTALEIHAPGLDTNTVEDLVKKAHEVCPYSNATRGNVDVKLSVK